jgi:hypothetical protein
MADQKISALTSATTPLAGTEVLPIVQSSATVKVSVANLTAGRAISATQLTLTTGNLIVASGQGVDFSATPGTGTSELLADYEEGTWAPTTTVAGATYTAQVGTYTKIGRLVSCHANLAWSAHTGAGSALVIGGLPFTNGSAATYPPIVIAGNLTMAAGTSISAYISPSNSTVTVLSHTDLTGADANYLIPASANITMVVSYEV